MNHLNRKIAFFLIFCLSAVLTFVFLENRKAFFKPQKSVVLVSSRSESGYTGKKKDTNREGSGEYPVELTYSNWLSFPGKSKSHYADRTPIGVKIADKDISYFTVTVQEGYLSDNDRENEKELHVYSNFGNDLMYAVCKNGKSAPFSSDIIQFSFYDSGKNLLCSRTVSVSYSEDTGDFFLSSMGEENLPGQGTVMQNS